MGQHAGNIKLKNVPKSRRLRDEFNGPIRSTDFWDNDGTTLLTQTEQPNRENILNENAELRKNPGALRALETFRFELSIPEIDMPTLYKLYPNLQAVDAGIRTQAWNHFINSDVSLPYRVRDRKSRRLMV